MLCKDTPETIKHITAGCKILADRAYMERHNKEASILDMNICAEFEKSEGQNGIQLLGWLRKAKLSHVDFYIQIDG